MIRTLNAEESELLVRWRLRANDIAPFMGHLLFSLRFVSVDDSITSTACGFNDEFVIAINFKGLNKVPSLDLQDADCGAFVLLHEAQHFLLNHQLRANDMETRGHPQLGHLWNIAGDLEINVILEEITHRRFEEFYYPSTFGLQDKAGAEFYYRLLLAQVSDDDADAQESDGNDDSQESEEEDDDSQESDEDDDSQSSNGNEDSQGSDEGDGSQGQTSASQGCGTAAGETIDQRAVRQIRQYVTNKYGEISKQEAEDIVKETLSSGKQAGMLPSDVVDTIIGSMTPTINWRQVLRNVIISAGSRVLGREKRDWRRPNRRVRINMPQGKVFIPGHKSTKLNVAVVRDTSGSMDEHMLEQVNNEITDIIRKLGNARVNMRVIDCDVAVHQTQKVSQGTLSKLQNVAGRGGTDMMIGIDYVVSSREETDVLIVITDGESPWDKQYMVRLPVIVCLVPCQPGMGVPENVRHAIPSWVRQVVEVVDK